MTDKTAKTVLLIWDANGAAPIRFYTLQGELAEIAIDADGQYVNSDIPDDSAVFSLNDKIEDVPYTEKPLELNPANYTHIVVAGFLP